MILKFLLKNIYKFCFFTMGFLLYINNATLIKTQPMIVQHNNNMLKYDIFDLIYLTITY